jgi:hypothetical protein
VVVTVLVNVPGGGQSDAPAAQPQPSESDVMILGREGQRTVSHSTDETALPGHLEDSQAWADGVLNSRSPTGTSGDNAWSIVSFHAA